MSSSLRTFKFLNDNAQEAMNWLNHVVFDINPRNLNAQVIYSFYTKSDYLFFLFFKLAVIHTILPFRIRTITKMLNCNSFAFLCGYNIGSEIFRTELFELNCFITLNT